MKINQILQIALLMELSLGTFAGAQTAIASSPSLDPHLFLTLKDFEARKAIAQHESWAKAALAAVLKEADGYPQDYLKQFGLTKVEAPKTFWGDDRRPTDSKVQRVIMPLSNQTEQSAKPAKASSQTETKPAQRSRRVAGN